MNVRDEDLMQLHLDVLYQQNEVGALTVMNEPPFEPAPTVHIGVTRDGKQMRFSSRVDEVFKKRLENTIQDADEDLLVDLIHQLMNRADLHEFRMGPTYVFPTIEEISPKVLHVTEQHKERLKDDFLFTYMNFDMKQPCYVVMELDRIASICCTARQSAVAAEASVYTHPKSRGKGYGAAVAQAWARDVQRQGRVALYSTTWDNFASQGIARTLNMRQYGVDVSIE